MLIQLYANATTTTNDADADADVDVDADASGPAVCSHSLFEFWIVVLFC